MAQRHTISSTEVLRVPPMSLPPLRSAFSRTSLFQKKNHPLTELNGSRWGGFVFTLPALLAWTERTSVAHWEPKVPLLAQTKSVSASATCRREGRQPGAQR